MSFFWILIEGEDDKRFAQRILSLIDCRWYRFFSYSMRKDEDVRSFVKSLHKMGSPYVFLSDSDGRPYDEVVSEVMRRYGVYQEEIFVAEPEIEAWIVAGLSEKYVRRFKDNFITKELFYERLCGKKRKDVSCLMEFIDKWSLQLATERCPEIKRLLQRLKDVCG